MGEALRGDFLAFVSTKLGMSLCDGGASIPIGLRWLCRTGQRSMKRSSKKKSVKHQTGPPWPCVPRASSEDRLGMLQPLLRVTPTNPIRSPTKLDKQVHWVPDSLPCEGTWEFGVKNPQGVAKPSLD